MKKASAKNDDDGMRDYYDFSGGVRGKYAKRYSEGTNVVVLDPDVAEVFRDTESVNQTLRAVARIINVQSRKKARPRGRSRRHEGTRVGRGS